MRTQAEQSSIVVNAVSSKKRRHFNDKWHKYLELNADLRRWYESYHKKGGQVADIYLRNLMRFCESHLHMAPWEFANLPRREMENITMDFVDEMEKAINPQSGELYASEYIEKHIDAVKSWARWNSKPFERKIAVAQLNPRPRASKEVLPTQEELRGLLYAATTPLRTRVIISGTAHGGLRFMSYGDYKGADGLRIKDFPELKIICDTNGKQKEVSFEKVPAQVVIRWNLSKIRKEYRSKWSEEACEILKQYLDSRIHAGEFLTPESGIIVTTDENRKRLDVPHGKLGVEDRSPFICSNKISTLVRRAMDAVGLSQRPYIWRHYFDTSLMSAESKGYITHSFGQFLMGHEGDMEVTYTLNKQTLPQQLVDTIHESYKKCQTLLQTRLTSDDIVSEEKARRISKIQLFSSLGFSEKEIEEKKLLEKKEEEVLEIVKSKILSASQKKPQLYVKPEL